MFSSENKSLSMYFPLNAVIVDFSERFEIEKLNIVVSILKKYSNSLMRNLFVKESLVYALIEIDYKNNISTIRKLIHKIVGENKMINNDIYIDIQHIFNLIPYERLPYYIKKSNDEDFININKFSGNQKLVIDNYQNLLDNDFSGEAINTYCNDV